MNVNKNRQKAIRILSYISIFLFSGIVYYLIEIAYRGYSHWTMFVLSGIAGVLICQINNFFTYDMDYLLQLLLSTTIITTLEYIFGIIFNSDYSIWNYSNLPFNYKGQICLYFSLLWMVLSAIFIPILDYIEWKIFHYKPETPPYYKIFGFKIFQFKE